MIILISLFIIASLALLSGFQTESHSSQQSELIPIPIPVDGVDILLRKRNRT